MLTDVYEKGYCWNYCSKPARFSGINQQEMIFPSDVSGHLFWTKTCLVNADRPADAGAVMVCVSPALEQLLTWPPSIHLTGSNARTVVISYPEQAEMPGGKGGGGTSAPPLCTDVPSVMSPRPTAADVPGGKWSVAAFLTFTAYRRH